MKIPIMGPDALFSQLPLRYTGTSTQKTLNGVPEVLTYGPNDRILTAGPRSYVTDNNGNITGVTVGGQATTLGWNFDNKLTRIDYPGGSFNTFKYNGLGLRVQKIDSSGTQNYLTDGAEPASSVIADSAATYTPGISERRGGISRFYHGDHLGSTRGITNSTQTPTDSLLHDAFGGLVSRTGTTPTPFGYVGQQQYQTDSDSGLLLLGHRYYDPYTGRFITQDPIGDDRNWYGYVANDPLSWIDPRGLLRAYGMGGADLIPPEEMEKFEREQKRRERWRIFWEVVEDTPLLGGVGGKVKSAKEIIRGGTYFLKDAFNNVMRTGRSKNLERRRLDHLRDKDLGKFRFEVDKRTDSYNAQRGPEQIIHERYNPPYDKRNAVGPKNLNREKYRRAGEELGD